ncbi:hypothetical protein EPR50_G00038920 [Perca flavescens]|uniref:Uncharacterized protein n=1 Tax=Perca flavescens TaxID=8167 RepID=A0A484DET9_PERFV|nr:hypothetical protein EPR50_G00038920 [Perca flavescens]
MENTSIPEIDNDPAWKTSHKLCNVTASGKNYCTSIMSGNMTKYSNAHVIGSHHTGIKGTANLHQEQAPSKEVCTEICQNKPPALLVSSK